jgi:ribosome recycling factor
MDIVDQTKAKMQAAVEHLKTELKSIRTGRANAGMVDGILVEVYGSNMRIKEIASVSSTDSKTLLITPFDPKNAPFISKAIEKANIGMMPILDGHSVRLKIPMMDEAMRKEMVKLCHKKREESKVRIRTERQKGNELLKKAKTASEIPEDLFKKQEKQIQELTDKACKEADDISTQKEEEVVHL